MNLNQSVARDCLINATLLNAQLRVMGHVNRVNHRSINGVSPIDMSGVDQLLSQIDALGEFCRDKAIDVTSNPFYQNLDDIVKSRFEMKCNFRRLVVMDRSHSIGDLHSNIAKHHKIKCVLGGGKYYLLSPSESVIDVDDDCGLPMYSRVWHVFRPGQPKYSIRINARVLIELYQLIFDQTFNTGEVNNLIATYSPLLDSEQEQIMNR